MVYAKKELFDDVLQSSAVLFKSLGHLARLAILKYLAEIKTCMIGDIADELPLSRTTVNQHLKELKEAGLIVGTITGVRTCYCINIDKVTEIETLVGGLFQSIKNTENYCCN